MTLQLGVNSKLFQEQRKTAYSPTFEQVDELQTRFK